MKNYITQQLMVKYGVVIIGIVGMDNTVPVVYIVIALIVTNPANNNTIINNAVSLI